MEVMPPTIELDEAFVLDGWTTADVAAHRVFAVDPTAARFFGWAVEEAQAQPDAHYLALTAFVEWSAHERSLRRIVLKCDAENLASQPVAAKCGFALVGRDRNDLCFCRALP